MEVIHRGATGDRAPGNVEKERKNAIAGAQIQDEKMVEETVAYWDPTRNQEIATDIDARVNYYVFQKKKNATCVKDSLFLV